ncbi:bifunctional DNA primase/polymerase [Streptomyces sp. DG2A-72]|uniref:bifunctional DNA primase/polymerase n=1 Tax=Streptomyces sp. DG2A-72 TaxID=3051386 RepID=UPI00265C3F3D|nr:bifunctional DNA primase/polymerase [Streptomyces sp. DG2A-72]MDO0937139.1 bifunctional DNA primase/polymerase [Streptomyces sp. DG2A-72]
MSALTAALTYTARGWRVIWAPPGSKHPTMKGWPDLATTDTDTSVQWWAANPAANVCIATGRASNLWVLDIDDKDDAKGSATLAALEREYSELPLTYTIGTGSGGVHHYFTYDGIDFHLGNSAKKLGPGLDTRGEGGQVVAPPSRVDEPAHTMSYVVLVDVAPVVASAWLVGLLRPPAAPRPMTPSTPFTGPRRGDVGGILGWLAGVQPGNQDQALAWVVRAMRDGGLSPQKVGDLIWPVMSSWPCSRGPWTEADIERHLRSAYRGVAA